MICRSRLSRGQDLLEVAVELAAGPRGDRLALQRPVGFGHDGEDLAGDVGAGRLGSWVSSGRVNRSLGALPKRTLSRRADIPNCRWRICHNSRRNSLVGGGFIGGCLSCVLRPSQARFAPWEPGDQLASVSDSWPILCVRQPPCWRP